MRSPGRNRNGAVLRGGSRMDSRPGGKSLSWQGIRLREGEETRMAAFRGSCICGEVVFEVEAPFDLFLNCHCTRCRKATGTAHSCEVIAKASALRWLRGEASVVRFDLPHARSFATAFCKTCGSPMPHLTRSGHEAIIPAGGFDEPLGAAPDRHVHWASRADWYVHGDGLLLQD
ncbi:MAG TPA: GFA family protein [Xanthobacteraceae bacterium]|nr:GFA family protein [Xanthobacteraceae bacterium]